METLTIKLYERLKEKLGGEDTSLLIEFIEEKVKGEGATKEDILKLDKRVSGLERKMKLYFILIAILIIITNQILHNRLKFVAL